MNISTVNELIQSLESAGELSIKERKYLELAKAYLDVTAENVGLRPLIAENWNMRDLLRQLMAGRPGGVYFNKWEKLIVGVLNTPPATDAYLARIKADGAEACVRALVTSDDDDFSDAPNICAMVAYQLREGADK
ncbi:hypothetical protein [Klebsiella grimontii]|uniref:hypothetical protein n=1 Tax=Klebsiella grimontii TaxID=2058152 RepID=UPI003B980CAD